MIQSISIHKILGILLFLAASVNSFGQKTHIGTWRGNDREDIGCIKFTEKGYSFLIANNDTIGGESYLQNGIRAKLTYVIDYTSKPINIDFIVTRLNDNRELRRMVGIVEFIGETKMKIRLNTFNSKRPVNFLPEGNADTMVFEKVE
jgi:hypothetical protein